MSEDAGVSPLEHARLLRGKGRFVDDIRLPNMLHGVFRGSEYAHALIRKIDTAGAREIPGVRAVLTGHDLRQILKSDRMPLYMPTGDRLAEIMSPVLATEEVSFIGQPVVLVVADSRQVAETAAAEISVDYEELEPVHDASGALLPDAPLAHRDYGTNLLARRKIGYGDVATGFREAKHTVRLEAAIHRGAGSPLETRGVAVGIDENLGTVNVWSSTQIPHALLHTLRQILGLDEMQVRVLSPDIGGGFGTKAIVYPEEIAIVAAALKLRSPVKWTEDRREHLLSAVQERDQFWTAEMAVDGAGKILAVRGTLIQDMGAFAAAGINLPLNSAVSVPGPYVVPAYEMEFSCVATNKPVAVAVRGAGYPQSCFVMERLLDRAAKATGLGREEIRARNFIPPDRFPYELPLLNRSGKPTVYDSGDFLTGQNRILERSNFRELLKRKPADRGKRVGVGLANGLKGTGRGPFEYARVHVSPSGRIRVSTGVVSMGTGIQTGLAQICSGILGVPMDRIEVVTGDTANAPYGIGGFSSRQLSVAGPAVRKASERVREKAIAAASQMLEANPADLELQDGHVRIAGAPGSGVPLATIADHLRGLPGRGFMAGIAPGLEAEDMYRVDDLSFAFSSHVCVVEVDIDTGEVRVVRYFALQDSGTIINARLLKAQVVGGIVHGIGNTLFERIGYDEQAQPFTTTLAEYLLPAIGEIPEIDVITLETPAPGNPLGTKGVGEGGTVPAAAAIVSAIEDALGEFGVRIDTVPVTPVRLLELINQARDRTGAP